MRIRSRGGRKELSDDVGCERRIGDNGVAARHDRIIAHGERPAVRVSASKAGDEWRPGEARRGEGHPGRGARARVDDIDALGFDELREAADIQGHADRVCACAGNGVNRPPRACNSLTSEPPRLAISALAPRGSRRRLSRSPHERRRPAQRSGIISSAGNTRRGDARPVAEKVSPSPRDIRRNRSGSATEKREPYFATTSL